MIDVADSNTVYYYHFDGLGSVIALSDNSGDIVEQYSYDVFGEPNRTSDVNNPYMFTGRRMDILDGGEKNSFDPEEQYVEGMNLYSYVNNNPLNNRDPRGLKPWYGKYCGRGSKPGPPKDDLDKACKKHDDCYSSCRGPGGIGGLMLPSKCKRKCDRVLCVNAHLSRCAGCKCKSAKIIIKAIFCWTGIHTF